MNSFNADLAGYLSDVYVQWRTLAGGWEGSFDYNTSWMLSDDVDKELKPGRYKLFEESSEYEIDVDRVILKGESIYRVYFKGVGEMPLERTWKRARELHSSLSGDEQVMEKIKSGHKSAGEQWVEDLERKESGDDGCLGCFAFLAVVAGVLWALEYFFDIF